MSGYIGIDFGTTNSVLSVADEDGAIRTARYRHADIISETFRTVLCFWKEGLDLKSEAGPWAIASYLTDTQDSRFIQSIKTYLASTTFSETRIYGSRFTLENLIGLFLKKLWEHAAADLGLAADPAAYTIVSGRPVNFAGQNPDNQFAENRLRLAYQDGGLPLAGFAYEPEGAAYHYAQRTRETARILVADFGGGTSDFSVIECTPDTGIMRLQPIAHTGVGVAGDIFDFRIIDHLIAPALGKGSRYKSFDKWLDMPVSYYRSFAAWHLLSLLNTPKTLREIEELSRASDAPDKVMALHQMIERELGYHLYRSVARAKAEISKAEETQFLFEVDGIKIDKTLRRRDFNKWIADDVARIATAVDEVMEKSGSLDTQIDRVFMTGGTSFVPAVRDMIGNRFGHDKLAAGDEFTSVSGGLALIARARAMAR